MYLDITLNTEISVPKSIIIIGVMIVIYIRIYIILLLYTFVDILVKKNNNNTKVAKSRPGNKLLYTLNNGYKAIKTEKIPDNLL